MESIVIQKNTITFRGKSYNYEYAEPIDNLSVHIVMSGNVFCFIVSETDINGEKFEDTENFINQLNLNR